MKYIAYGSNMVEEQMAFRCPNARLLGTGWLPNHRLEFYLHATVERSRARGARVPVAVWEIDAEDEQNLDYYEGFPKYYTKHKRTVQMDDGSQIEGMVYIGGEVELPASTSTTLKFYLVVGGQLAPVDTAHLTCTMSTALTGTSVTNAGVLTAGSTTGNAEVTATYNDGSASFTCPVNVTVTQAST